jgi:hypothetical protein
MNDTLGHPTNILVYNGSSSSAARTIYQADYRGGAAHDGQLPLWTVVVSRCGLRCPTCPVGTQGVLTGRLVSVEEVTACLRAVAGQAPIASVALFWHRD